MTSPVIFSYRFDGKGGGKALLGEDISKELKANNPAWAHLDVNSDETEEWLKQNVDYLDSIIIDAILAEETRPRLEEYDEGSLLILRGVNLNPNSDPEDMISVRLWIDRHRIISLQRRELKATTDIEKKLIDGKGPKDAADFMVQLATRLIERIEPVINELDENTDNLEENIIEEPDIKLRTQIVRVRKEAILLRRYLAPQREVINRLRSSEQKWLTKAHKRQLHENYDRIARYVEELDSIRERTQIVQDELQNALSDRMNKNMYVLSVIAAIFLPLGFLTGLLGINVGGIPGAENQDSFYIFCGILITIVIIQVALFKKMKWF